MNEEAVRILINETRDHLLNNDPRSAIRRLNLFELMYFSDEEEQVANPGKKLILISDTGDRIICEEYMPDGRVHLLESSRYAIFDNENMHLEINKAVIPIREIRYEGDEWPKGCEDVSLAGLTAYFFGDRP